MTLLPERGLQLGMRFLIYFFNKIMIDFDSVSNN